MLIFGRQLNRFLRLFQNGPTFSRDCTLGTHRFRPLTLFGSFSMNAYLNRQIIDANVRPYRASTRYLCFRFLILGGLLICNNSFRFSPYQELSVLNCFRRLIKVRVRSRRNVIKLELNEFFFGERAVTVLIGFHCTVSFKIASPVTRCHYFLILFNDACKFSRRNKRTITIRCIVARCGTSKVVSSRFLTSSRDLDRSIKQELFHVFGTCSRVTSISWRSFRTQWIM